MPELSKVSVATLAAMKKSDSISDRAAAESEIARRLCRPASGSQQILHASDDLGVKRIAAKREIEIGGHRYVNPLHLASILGISVRTLSRWNVEGGGPPRIKLGKQILFDIETLSKWLATREV
jgi:hypothetical protein